MKLTGESFSWLHLPSFSAHLQFRYDVHVVQLRYPAHFTSSEMSPEIMNKELIINKQKSDTLFRIFRQSDVTFPSLCPLETKKKNWGSEISKLIKFNDMTCYITSLDIKNHIKHTSMDAKKS